MAPIASVEPGIRDARITLARTSWKLAASVGIVAFVHSRFDALPLILACVAGWILGAALEARWTRQVDPRATPAPLNTAELAVVAVFAGLVFPFFAWLMMSEGALSRPVAMTIVVGGVVTALGFGGWVLRAARRTSLSSQVTFEELLLVLERLGGRALAFAGLFYLMRPWLG
jgi:hypothetical protein